MQSIYAICIVSWSYKVVNIVGEWSLQIPKIDACDFIRNIKIILKNVVEVVYMQAVKFPHKEILTIFNLYYLASMYRLIEIRKILK